MVDTQVLGREKDGIFLAEQLITTEDGVSFTTDIGAVGKRDASVFRNNVREV